MLVSCLSALVLSVEGSCLLDCALRLCAKLPRLPQSAA